MNKIRFHHYEGEEQRNPNPGKIFGRRACAFANVQGAVSTCLELLGARAAVTPIILPVTAGIHTAAGVLRSGGQPVLIDIDPETYQMDPEILAEAIEAFSESVVVLTRPFGLAIDPRLNHLLQDHPYIVVDDVNLPAVDEDTFGVFDIYSLAAAYGGGAVAFTPYARQAEQLRVAKSGALGTGAGMSRVQSLALRGYGDTYAYRKARGMAIRGLYEDALENAGLEDIIIRSEGGEDMPFSFPIRVPSAQQVVAFFGIEGIEIALGLYPLHFTDEIRERYTEEPSYEVAEGLADGVVMLPIHPNVDEEDVSHIVGELVRLLKS